MNISIIGTIFDVNATNISISGNIGAKANINGNNGDNSTNNGNIADITIIGAINAGIGTNNVNISSIAANICDIGGISSIAVDDNRII